MFLLLIIYLLLSSFLLLTLGFLSVAIATATVATVATLRNQGREAGMFQGAAEILAKWQAMKGKSGLFPLRRLRNVMGALSGCVATAGNPTA